MFSAVGSLGRLREERTELFSWTIIDFFSLVKDRSNLGSPTFSYLGLNWALLLNAWIMQRDKYMSIDVRMLDACADDKTVCCSVSLKNSMGAVEKETTRAEAFGESNFYLELILDGVDLGYLEKRRSELVPGGALTIIFTMRGLKTNPPGLVPDLERLLASGDVSDVTIRAGGEDFRAHRAILAARSDVFRAMFVNDTPERASGVVDIGDCEPDIFRKFLAYLYAGRLEELPFEDAIGLYVIADKYQVEELRREYQELIRSSLSLTTFCSAATLMVKHGQSEGMTRLVADFLGAKMAEILETAAWEVFSFEHPDEAQELLREALDSNDKQRNQTAAWEVFSWKHPDEAQELLREALDSNAKQKNKTASSKGSEC